MTYRPARVQTRDTIRYPGEPKTFEDDTGRHEITEILERWSEAATDPSFHPSEYFRVLDTDGRCHVLRYHTLFDSWWIREEKKP